MKDNMQIRKIKCQQSQLANKQTNKQGTSAISAEFKTRQVEHGRAHLAQLFRVLMKLFQDGQGLLLGAVLQDPLDYSAAIRVCGKHKNLPKKTQTKNCIYCTLQ